MNVQALMRRARKAVHKEQYDEACQLYQQALDTDEMAGNLDLQLRLGWCYERLGQVDEACVLYQYVIHQYIHDGENKAAHELQRTVDAIRQSTPDLANQTAAEVKLDDSKMMDILRAMGDVIELQEGEVLCDVGEVSDTLWLLQQGTMVVRVDGYDEDEPDELHAKPGVLVLIGEIGIFTQQRRIAKVWAKTPCHVYAIPEQSIRTCQKEGFQEGMERLLRERWVDPILSRHAIFERVNDIDRHRLSLSLEVVELQAGACLVDVGEEHENAYLLQVGCLFFLHGESNTQTDVDAQALSGVTPGDMVHLGGLLRGYKSEYRIMTATPVRLLRLSRDVFDAFAVRRPWIVQALLHHSSRPKHLQVMHPDDDYLWKINRHIELNRIL
jgi:CRP-like cAMP-binding protein